jgi:glycosyltransferase involved in cell wall biosynthesis
VTLPVTAVIPTYERAHLVGRAIDSVLAQQPRPVQVIVVDDGSTDDTGAVLAGYGDAITAIRQDNAGGAAARNLGTSLASTPWVAFLDSDDVWLPGHLARLTAAVEGTGGAADLYFADVARTEAEGGGTTFEAAGLCLDGPWLLRTDARCWAVAPRQPTMLQGSMVSVRAFDEVGRLWPALSSRHDTHFFYRMLIERPACAVAGIGAAMTSDEAADRRLTAAHSAKGRRYWECTVRLYGDLLDLRQDPDERRILRDLLARGHKRLARTAWADGRRLDAAADLGRGLVASPLRPGHPTPGVARARRALGGS